MTESRRGDSGVSTTVVGFPDGTSLPIDPATGSNVDALPVGNPNTSPPTIGWPNMTLDERLTWMSNHVVGPALFNAAQQKSYFNDPTTNGMPSQKELQQYAIQAMSNYYVNTRGNAVNLTGGHAPNISNLNASSMSDMSSGAQPYMLPTDPTKPLSWMGVMPSLAVCQQIWTMWGQSPGTFPTSLWPSIQTANQQMYNNDQYVSGLKVSSLVYNNNDGKWGTMSYSLNGQPGTTAEQTPQDMFNDLNQVMQDEKDNRSKPHYNIQYASDILLDYQTALKQSGNHGSWAPILVNGQWQLRNSNNHDVEGPTVPASQETYNPESSDDDENVLTTTDAQDPNRMVWAQSTSGISYWMPAHVALARDKLYEAWKNDPDWSGARNARLPNAGVRAPGSPRQVDSNSEDEQHPVSNANAYIKPEDWLLAEDSSDTDISFGGSQDYEKGLNDRLNLPLNTYNTDLKEKHRFQNNLGSESESSYSSDNV